MKRETLLDLFADFAGLPDPFLIYDDGLRVHRRSYRETAAAARSLAARLREGGVSKGDRVLIWSENRPEWVAAFWACLLSGAVIVPADYRASAALVMRIADAVTPRVILIGEDVDWSPEREPRPWKLIDVVDWIKVDWSNPPPPAPGPVELSRDDLAEIIFTSGATSEPKGVRITHRNILANLVPVETEVRKYRGWGRPFFPIRFLNLLPLSHMFGQVLATFIPPMLPGVTVFTRGFNPEQILALIRTQRVSVLVSVPKMLEILRDYVLRSFPETGSAPAGGKFWPLRWWRYRRVHRLFGWKFWALIVGAAPLPPEVEEFWTRLGFLVIQGYGLTETAPIVTLNHPFHARRGTAGTPIGGVKVKIAEDGEILVRGENVTGGYWSAPGTPPLAQTLEGVAEKLEDGWLHTGDIGSMDATGNLTVRGRKKEMIVTPEGLKVFPEDVERVLLQIPGVKDAAVVGRDRVHAVLVPSGPETNIGEIVRQANSRLEDFQRIQGVSTWPQAELPRTSGTSKLKRAEVARWVESGGASGFTAAGPAERGKLSGILARYARGRSITPTTTLEELGLSSLERVELMMESGLTEAQMQQAATVGELTSGELSGAGGLPEPSAPPVDDFPRWTRSWLARSVRNVSLPTWILTIGRIFAWTSAEGLENLTGFQPPVIFAANHQSLLDVPCILTALPYRWRKRVAPAAAREWFTAHFHPDRFPLRKRFSNGFSYYLAALFFNMFPLPQRESGAMGALRYAGELFGDGWCVLIFPEGVRTEAGEIHPFQPGVGMMASRLQVPVVPVRLEGLDQVLHQSWHMARPGRVRVKFGPPLHLTGDDYAELARRVEQAVRSL